MRILVVNAFFPPLTTGSAHFSLDVARQYAKQGHDVLVLAAKPAGVPEEETIDGVVVRRLPARWLSPGLIAFNYSIPFVTSPGIWRRMRTLFDDFNPDAVHINGQFFDLSIWATRLARRRKRCTILTLHTPLTHTNRLLRWIISSVDRLVLRPMVGRQPTKLAAVDRFTMEMYQRRYRPRTKDVTFIPATLSINNFSKGDGQAIRDRFALASRPVVLSFGHVIPIRSRVPLIKALPELIKQVPDVVVLVVGGIYDDSFLRVAEQLNVRDHVMTTGRVDHADVPDYIAAADIESHDLDGHGIGITSLEVMAAGVPIVASVDRGVFPGVSLDEWPLVGILEDLSPTELADELAKRLLMDANDTQEVLTQQRRLLEQVFDVEVVAARYLDLFGASQNTRAALCE